MPSYNNPQTLVAIHQPNFFPWLGYFDKIRRADVFIFLDAVAYPRAGSGGMGSWCNRVRLLVQREARWLTCPLRRLSFGEPINAAQIDDDQPWRGKFLRTLEANYRTAPHYAACMAFLEPIILDRENNLATFNIGAITAIAAHLGLSARFVRQSTLPHTGKATARLISLVKSVGGSAYLEGGGAGGYQCDDLFGKNELTLVKQNFNPSPYGDESRFVPGLSVIDYLMWDGRPLSAGD